MKNMLIGLVVGLIIGFLGTNWAKKSEPQIKQNELVKTSVDENLIDDVGATENSNDNSVTIISSNSRENSESLTKPQTIEDYQILVDKLRHEMTLQNKAVKQLAVKNKKLQDSLDSKTRSSRELEALSVSDIEQAKQTIQSLLPEASPEYAEVLKSALDGYNAENGALPGTDALLRHYAEEPDFSWSDVAQAYIQNYFAAQTDSRIQLAQVSCRKTYCEVYGFYSLEQELEDPRQAGLKIQSIFSAMQKAPGFSDLFVGLESASININTENSYMSFHNFIRSSQQ